MTSPKNREFRSEKIWGQAVTRLCERKGLNVKTACRLFGHCRQAYYQQKSDGEELLRREARILSAIAEIRAVDPGIGGYKLWLMLCDLFGRGRMPGRDAFLKLLRSHKLLRKPPRRRHTTNSNHRYHKWKNLIKGYVPDAANRLWVSDITYIETDEGCCYLHLVTDCYSHKIVGWSLSSSLSAFFTLKALRMAVAQTGRDNLEGLVHHSDRGIQYCCDLYVGELQKHHIAISMTEDYRPTDNAVAERVNGTIKTERVYVQPQRFKDRQDAERQIAEFIDFYNNRRPHMSIGMQTPETAHCQQGEQRKCWKRKKFRRKDEMEAERFLPLQT